MISIKKGAQYWYAFWRRKNHKRKTLVGSFFAIDALDVFHRDEQYRKAVKIIVKRETGVTLVVGEDVLGVCTGESSELVKYEIPVSRTSSSVGGYRDWFCCPVPGCRKRVRKLYLFQKSLFACRHCLRLGYRSQVSIPVERYLTAKEKIENHLEGLGGNEYSKPRYMHTGTFERLIQKLEWYQERIDNEIASAFGFLLEKKQQTEAHSMVMNIS